MEIGGYRGTFIPTYTTRLNYDRTISPTLLLHLGAGYYHTSFSDHAPFLNFNPSAFDLTGFLQDRQFPSVTGMCGQLVGPFGTPTSCIQGATRLISWRHAEYRDLRSNPVAKLRGEAHLQRQRDLGPRQLTPSRSARSCTWSKPTPELFRRYPSGCADAALRPPPRNPSLRPTVSTDTTRASASPVSCWATIASITQTPVEFTREGSQEWGAVRSGFLEGDPQADRELRPAVGLRHSGA